MTISEIIYKALEYNKLLKQITEADIWYGNPKVPQDKKDGFDKKYDEAWQKIGKLSGEFDKMGITYRVTNEYNEVTDGIELPEALRRNDIEGFLKKWHEHLKSKEVVNL